MFEEIKGSALITNTPSKLFSILLKEIYIFNFTLALLEVVTNIPGPSFSYILFWQING